jgi:tungstate transport system ATP-binding protein
MSAAHPALTSTPPIVVDLRDVHVQFGRQAALHGVNLRIHAGEVVALVGANGSGKSTLLRVMHGLVRVKAGSVERAAHALQAMLFQRPFMLRTSAQNNVALALWLRGMPWRRACEQALQALARVELLPQASQNARTLSGGQQQRLALARAWSMSPRVLLLDEPTASLDPHAKREVEELIAELAAPHAEGTAVTLVMASHNLGQVKRLATRVVYLEQGQVLADLPVQEFFDSVRLQAASPSAALFVKGELA